MVTIDLDRDEVMFLREVLRDYVRQMHAMASEMDMVEAGTGEADETEAIKGREEVVQGLIERLEMDIEKEAGSTPPVQGIIDHRNTDMGKGEMAA